MSEKIKKILIILLFPLIATAQNPLELLSPQDAAFRRNIATNTDLNYLIPAIQQMQLAQAMGENQCLVTYSVAEPMKDAAVNYLVNTLKYTVTSTPGDPGFQNVTEISWCDVSKAPVTGFSETVRVEGSNVTTTLQTLQNITGLSYPLLANSEYEFEAVLIVGTSNVTTGTGYGVNYSAAGAFMKSLILGTNTATTPKGWLKFTAFNSSQGPFLTASNLQGGVTIKGGIQTGANAGNLTIQHLKINTGTSTVETGSWLKVTKVK